MLIDIRARLGRLENDVSRLGDAFEREFDLLDLKYPTFDRVAKDYVPRSEHHQANTDRRNALVIWIAVASPFMTAVAGYLVHR